MKRLLLRADDLGYSAGVNAGILEAAQTGLVKSINVMVNMPMAAEGVNALRGSDVCLGLHCNISNGYPLSDPAKIPSLVAEDGAFLPSSAYWTGDRIINYEEAVQELELQYLRYLELVGEKPRFIDNHAVNNPIFFDAIRTVADRHGVKCFLDDNEDISYMGKSWVYTVCESSKEDYRPQQVLKDQLSWIPDEACLVMILHPGYIDDYLRLHSSLLKNRMKDLSMVCEPALKDWLHKNVEVISFDELYKL